MTLDGVALTVDVEGVIRGEHALVPLCNIRVGRTGYTPDRQQTALALLVRLGAVRREEGDGGRLLTHPQDFDPFVWY